MNRRTTSSQRAEKHPVGICNYESTCPIIQCLNTAYNEVSDKIQSKTEQKVDIVASFEM